MGFLVVLVSLPFGVFGMCVLVSVILDQISEEIGPWKK